MGCDWYDVKSICAFGTIVESNVDEFFEKMKDSEDLDFLLFSDCETGSLKDLKVKLFVYDKKTFFINQISMPGSYSIELSEHRTSIKEVPNSYPLNSIFPETTMDSFTPSFINILTTMGVGILGKNKESPNKKLKTFETIELYKKYFGYDD
jgi:hypothetical protein